MCILHARLTGEGGRSRPALAALVAQAGGRLGLHSTQVLHMYVTTSLITCSKHVTIPNTGHFHARSSELAPAAPVDLQKSQLQLTQPLSAPEKQSNIYSVFLKSRYQKSYLFAGFVPAGHLCTSCIVPQ